MKRAYIWTIALISMTTLIFTNCTPSIDDGTGDVFLRVSKGNLNNANSIAKIEVSIKASDITPNINAPLKKVANGWQGLIEMIPSGQDRLFTAMAYNGDGVLLYAGKAEKVEILSGKTSAVFIVLQQQTPPKPFDNTVPSIDSLTASSMVVGPQEEVELRASAHDEDKGDSISYSWTAQGGTLNSSNTASVKWTSPSDMGEYRLTVTVSDSKGASIAVSVNITVKKDTGSAMIEASFNTWPQVSSVYAFPGRVKEGGKIALSVFALDSDNDKLQYKWNDDGGECTGNFNSESTSDVVWTAPSKIPSNNRCKLTVVVTDGKGGTIRGSIVIQVGPELQFKSLSDKTAPKSSIDPPNGSIFNYTLQVTISCTDNESGCKRIVYTTDGSTPSFEPRNGTIVNGNRATLGLFSMNPLEKIRVRFASEDRSGNKESPKEATFISLN